LKYAPKDAENMALALRRQLLNRTLGAELPSGLIWPAVSMLVAQCDWDWLVQQEPERRFLRMRLAQL